MPHHRCNDPLPPNDIRAARLERGWSTTELARFVGVRQPTIIQWELRRFDPRPERKPLIAKLLGLDPETLLRKDRAA